MTGPKVVPLWFLRDLMVTAACSPVVWLAIKRWGWMSVALLGLCYVTRVFIPVHGFSANAFFWFSLGAYFAIYKLNMVEQLYKFRRPAYIVAIVTLAVLVWYNGRKGDGVHPNPQWVQLSYYAYVIAAVLSSVAIAVNLLRSGRVTVNRYMARASFFVYLAHPFVLGYVMRAVNRFVPEDNCLLLMAAYVVRPLLTVALCIALYWLLERYVPRLLAVLTGGRVALNDKKGDAAMLA